MPVAEFESQPFAPPKGAAHEVSVTIEAGKCHEDFQHLTAGEKRKYHWKASAPVDFNIHYHDGPEGLYPIGDDADTVSRLL